MNIIKLTLALCSISSLHAATQYDLLNFKKATDQYTKSTSATDRNQMIARYNVLAKDTVRPEWAQSARTYAKQRGVDIVAAVAQSRVAAAPSAPAPVAPVTMPPAAPVRGGAVAPVTMPPAAPVIVAPSAPVVVAPPVAPPMTSGVTYAPARGTAPITPGAPYPLRPIPVAPSSLSADIEQIENVISKADDALKEAQYKAHMAAQRPDEEKEFNDAIGRASYNLKVGQASFNGIEKFASEADAKRLSNELSRVSKAIEGTKNILAFEEKLNEIRTHLGKNPIKKFLGGIFGLKPNVAGAEMSYNEALPLLHAIYSNVPTKVYEDLQKDFLALQKELSDAKDKAAAAAPAASSAATSSPAPTAAPTSSTSSSVVSPSQPATIVPPISSPTAPVAPPLTVTAPLTKMDVNAQAKALIGEIRAHATANPLGELPEPLVQRAGAFYDANADKMTPAIQKTLAGYLNK